MKIDVIYIFFDDGCHWFFIITCRPVLVYGSFVTWRPMQSARRLKASLQNSLTFPAEIPIWSGSLMSADESLWDGFIFLRWKLSIDLPCFITKHPEQAEHRDKCKYSNQIGSISPYWPTARQRGKVLHVTNRSKYGVLSRDGNAWVLGSLVLRGFFLYTKYDQLFSNPLLWKVYTGSTLI